MYIYGQRSIPVRCECGELHKVSVERYGEPGWTLCPECQAEADAEQLDRAGRPDLAARYEVEVYHRGG